VDIYTVRSGDSWEELSRRTGGILKPSTLAIMNNYEPSQPPRAGERIKIVVEG
jgi:predicted Zn-dependent protease